MGKVMIRMLVGFIYAVIIAMIVFAVVYGKKLVIWCCNGGIKFPSLKLFSMNSKLIMEIFLTIVAVALIMAIVGFIFKKLKKMGVSKNGEIRKKTHKPWKWKGKLLYRASLFAALGITAYVFFNFGILTKLANILDIKILGANIPFIRVILTTMAIIFIVSFIAKTGATIRDMRDGIHRIWFPFVGQMSFAILWWMSVLIFTLILVSLGYHYMVIGLMKIGWNFFDLKVGEGHGTIAITLITLKIWIDMISHSYKPHIVSVPGNVGLVTENALGGEFYVHSAGIHFKYPTERTAIENFYSLETITVPFDEDFVSKDCGIVKVKGSFDYNADINNLIKYHQISEKTIIDGFYNSITSSLTKEIVKKNADEVRKQTGRIKKSIERLYKEKPHEKEREYGVQFTDVTLSDIGYDETTQNVFSTAFNAQNLIAIGKDLKELDQETVDNALLIEGKINKNVIVHKIIIEGLKEIDPNVAKTLATVGGKIASHYLSEKKGEK